MQQTTVDKSAKTTPVKQLAVGVVSVSLPPACTGQAVVIERLFAQNQLLNCTYFSEFLNDSIHTGPTYVRLGSLEKLHALSDPASKSKKEEFVKSYFAGLWSRTKLMIKEIEARRLDVLIACTGSPVDIPAAYLAAMLTGKPFVAYLFDDATFQWTSDRFRKICGAFEWFWVRSARATICANRSLAADYAKRHPVKPQVIENPASEVPHPEKDRSESQSDKPLRIVYTGSVYWAQADAMKNLLDAISGLNGAVEFHIYSEQSGFLKPAYDLDSPLVVCHPAVKEAEILKVQAQADILFLPLAFKSTITHTLMTAMPGKTGEYLASGTPVLVHAPKGSTVSEYFRSKQLGLVVDEPDPKLLTAAIIKLREDRELAKTLVNNARSESANFQPERLRARLCALLQGGARTT